MKLSFESFFIPILFLVVIWIVFGLQFLGFFQECYGIIPHDTNTLKGILFAPIFHADLEHIVNNSAVISVLLFLSFLFYQKITYIILIFGWILSGLFVWMFPYVGLFNDGNLGCHIGASGLIYVFISFLFFSGIFRRNIQLMAISLLIVYLYGSAFWGIFPQELFSTDPTATYISWETHLSGAVVGTGMSYFFKNYGPKKTVYPWQKKNHVDEQAEQLWQEYRENFPEDFEENQPNNEPLNKNDWKKLL
jgi:membrane associated rhomboid family serine protease